MRRPTLLAAFIAMGGALAAVWPTFAPSGAHADVPVTLNAPAPWCQKTYAKILQRIPMGRRTLLIVNAGRKRGFIEGRSAHVEGRPDLVAEVTELYTFRAKAVVDAPEAELGDAERVVFLPKCD